MIRIKITVIDCKDLSIAGKWKEAFEAYNEVLRINPDNAEVHFGLGINFFSQKDYVKAIDHLNRATSIDRTLGGPFLFLGYIAAEKDRDETKAREYVEKGRRLLEEAIKKNSTNHETCFELGDAFYFLKRYDEAIARFKEATRIKPDFAAAHYSLGTAYSETGLYLEAISSLKEGIRIDPNRSDPIGYFNIGYVYHKYLGQSQKAIFFLKKAIYISPDHAEAHFFLGNSYWVLDRNREAINSLEQAIRIKPDFAVAHYLLGEVYVEKKRGAKSIDHYLKALKLYQQENNRE